MKKYLAIILVVLAVLVLLVSGFLIIKGKVLPGGAKPTPTPEPVVRETPLEQRPYVTLTPRVDGRELTLEISRIKNAQTIEYELTYLSNDLSRGVIGEIQLKGEDNISRKLLLGTCSRNVCKYDENVTQGTLTLRFRGPDGVRKFTADFHLQRGREALTSIDNKFSLEGKLSPSAYYLTMPTIGLPDKISGKVAAGPYGVFTAGATAIKNGKVSFVGNESTLIYSWTGQSWQEVKSGLVNQLTTYIVVAPE